jgi:hypothetical protein
MAMLDRIVMNIIAQNFKFPFVSNLMFPEPPLPQASFPSTLPRFAHRPFGPPISQVIAGKPELDNPPANRKIRIVFRQRPQTMQMIRQQNDGILAKRIFCAGFRDGPMKGMPRELIGQKSTPPMADHRKKERSTGLKSTDIRRHGFIIKNASIPRHENLGSSNVHFKFDEMVDFHS